MTDVEKETVEALAMLMGMDGIGTLGEVRESWQYKDEQLNKRHWTFVYNIRRHAKDVDLLPYQLEFLLHTAWKVRARLPPALAVKLALKGAMDAR